MERKVKENEILEKVLGRIRKDKMNYMEDNRIKEDMLNIMKTRNFFNVKKIRDNIEETKRRIDELTSIESRINSVTKDEYDIIKNPIEEVEQDLNKRKSVLTKEIGNLIDMKKLLDENTDKEMIDEIKKISLEVIENNTTDKYIDFNNIKNDIRERLGKYFYVETECKPMIIAVIQEI